MHRQRIASRFALRLAAHSFLLLATLGGCATPSSRIERLYSELKSDVAEHGTGGKPDLSLQARHEHRGVEVRAILAEGKPESPEDRLHAAVLLYETTDPESLELAEKLGRELGMAGEKLGFRVAAEALDKRLVQQGIPQHYGTQYEWVPVLQEWRLYPIDPATTDADRSAMQVPTLKELYEGEKRLNGRRS